MFELKVLTGNEAFDGSYSHELPRILRSIAAEIEANGPDNHKVSVRDANGNLVGYWVEDGEV